MTDRDSSFQRRLLADWYRPRLTPLTISLVPVSFVFRTVVALRRASYRAGWLRSTRLAVPVIVVGNITVGGTGKTPLVRALAQALHARGWHPGIVSRGYGAFAPDARIVHPGDDPEKVGDEPLLLAAGAAPVAIGRNRVAAARCLVGSHPDVDVIIADDGLQHYALARTVEIVAVDAARGMGNGWLLPAGPLREPLSRMAAADALVRVIAAQADPGTPGPADTRLHPGMAQARGIPAFTARLQADAWRSVRTGIEVPDLAALPPGTVHAVAGIAHPQRFFAQLQALGIAARVHSFPDHHRYTRRELEFRGARAILMTEKDAVKCREMADARMFWLPVRAVPDPALVALIEDRICGSKAA